MSGTHADGRERFFKSIAERIAPERIEEVHIFPPIRQGGRETGVAVIAVRMEAQALEGAAPLEASDTEVMGPADPQQFDEGDDVPADPPPQPAEAPTRRTVYRAHYRLTLKGVDRGKWEVGITEEADAPASTVDEVVRGVHERAAVGDDGPVRLTGDAFRAMLAGTAEPWTTAR